jgi:hypothetical protein
MQRLNDRGCKIYFSLLFFPFLTFLNLCQHYKRITLEISKQGQKHISHNDHKEKREKKIIQLFDTAQLASDRYTLVKVNKRRK